MSLSYRDKEHLECILYDIDCVIDNMEGHQEKYRSEINALKLLLPTLTIWIQRISLLIDKELNPGLEEDNDE